MPKQGLCACQLFTEHTGQRCIIVLTVFQHVSSPDGCADTLELPSGAVAAGEGEGLAAAVVRVIIKQTASDLNTAAVHRYSHREPQERRGQSCAVPTGGLQG